ncbi:MAG TPA: hypothetical protein VF753_08275 [Terriglobales bacterium]
MNYASTAALDNVWIAQSLVLVTIVLSIAIYLRTKRGRPLDNSTVIAEEKHASLGWGIFLLIIPVTIIAFTASVGNPAVRWAALAPALLVAGSAVFALGGFRYRFSTRGVEIYTLGFRLRSIPASDIRDYSVGSWSAWRGYGIRGVGSSRAYVWGNRVVHIRTTDGDIYLGHDDPERVVRDMDMMKELAR